MPEMVQKTPKQRNKTKPKQPFICCMLCKLFEDFRRGCKRVIHVVQASFLSSTFRPLQSVLTKSKQTNKQTNKKKHSSCTTERVTVFEKFDALTIKVIRARCRVKVAHVILRCIAHA